MICLCLRLATLKKISVVVLIPKGVLIPKDFSIPKDFVSRIVYSINAPLPLNKCQEPLVCYTLQHAPNTSTSGPRSGTNDEDMQLPAPYARSALALLSAQRPFSCHAAAQWLTHCRSLELSEFRLQRLALEAQTAKTKSAFRL